MAKTEITGEQQEVVKFLLKKSEQKDPLPKAHEDNVDIKEVEALTKKIKDKIRA